MQQSILARSHLDTYLEVKTDQLVVLARLQCSSNHWVVQTSTMFAKSPRVQHQHEGTEVQANDTKTGAETDAASVP